MLEKARVGVVFCLQLVCDDSHRLSVNTRRGSWVSWKNTTKGTGRGGSREISIKSKKDLVFEREQKRRVDKGVGGRCRGGSGGGLGGGVGKTLRMENIETRGGEGFWVLILSV